MDTNVDGAVPATAQPASAAVDSRSGTPEQLRDLLALVSAAEVRSSCALLYAGFSLKHDVAEGGMSEEQAVAVRSWKRALYAAGLSHLTDHAHASGLLERLSSQDGTATAAGVPASAGSDLELAPFSISVLDGLIAAAGTRSATAPAIEAAARAGALDPATLGRFDTAGDPFDGSALRADYLAVVAQAERKGQRFGPVRPTVGDPTTRPQPVDRPGATAHTLLVDPFTVAVAELFSDAWDVTLLVLPRLVPATAGPAGTGGVVPRPAGADAAADLEVAGRTARALLDTVVRPLGEVLTRLPAGGREMDACAGAPFADSPVGASAASVGERLWLLAVAATRLRNRPGAPAELIEATAGLQALAARLAPPDGPNDRFARLAELAAIQAGLPQGIQVATNGPYLATNATEITTHLGEPLALAPQLALCRCGRSQDKPFCDGAHGRTEFTGEKAAGRVPDQRDAYDGLQATIFDNRGICAHSGFCTDRLSTVFRAHEDRFVSPSGGRLDQIIQAVRTCPSGALSFGTDRHEDRAQVDQRRPPSIEVSLDGPYRVTGGIPLIDEASSEVPRAVGSSREHYSLCRCGQSQNKPFCSGMHWYVDFHDPLPADFPTLFQWAGGLPALLRMTRLFYSKYVPEDPLLSPLFADMSPDHPERVACWLSEVFGGPPFYTERYGGYTRMISQHLGKGITEDHRSRWARLIAQSADDARLPADAEFRAAFMSYVEWGSRIAVENSTIGAHPPENMPVPRWWWVCDATPGARVSATAAPVAESEAVALPATGEPLSFAAHIKPLFRSRDRQSMSFAFDLWKYEDVKLHAAAILTRLRAGTMPCDGAWPPDHIDAFTRWLDTEAPA